MAWGPNLSPTCFFVNKSFIGTQPHLLVYYCPGLFLVLTLELNSCDRAIMALKFYLVLDRKSLLIPELDRCELDPYWCGRVAKLLYWVKRKKKMYRTVCTVRFSFGMHVLHTHTHTHTPILKYINEIFWNINFSQW